MTLITEQDRQMIEAGHEDARLTEREIAALQSQVEMILDHHPGSSVMIAVAQLARMSARLVYERADFSRHSSHQTVKDYMLLAFDDEAGKL